MKTVQGLQKGIVVLGALEKTEGASLHQLHLQTGYPKATLLRLLATLEASDLVWRAHVDGRYRSLISLRPASPVSYRHRLLARVAAPHLAALRDEVIWPSDLFVRGPREMRLIETTRSHTLLGTYGDPYGNPVDLLRSAAGRCYLAFCSERERGAALRALGVQDAEQRELHLLFEQFRAQGYAISHRDWHGQAVLPPDSRRRRHAAISVPVKAGSRVQASLNLIWIASLLREAEVVERLMPRLVRAASDIGSAYRDALKAMKSLSPRR